MLDRGQVILDGAGRAVRMIGAMADISSRKQAEERIHNQALRQRLIAEFGQQAFASSDVEDVLARAVELVTVALKADFCTVLGRFSRSLAASAHHGPHVTAAFFGGPSSLAHGIAPGVGAGSNGGSDIAGLGRSGRTPTITR